MTHASVFSGIGGPEVAATMLGWDNLFHCEINPFGRAVLDYWYPKAKSYEDITKTDFSEWRGRVDVLTGGFPCQPFSYAGQRRGAEDDRYLWPYMFKCIDAIRPTWVVAENVGGILTMVERGEVSEVGVQGSLFGEEDVVRGYELRETFTLERICDDLETHGYAVQPVLVPACAVGAPHRRDRVFIVGRRRDDFVADPDNGADGRAAGADEGEGGAQRLQERHEVREPDEPNQVRREGAVACQADNAEQTESGRPAADTYSERREESEQPGRGKNTAETRARVDNRAERFGSNGTVANTNGNRGDEMDEHLEPEQPNGAITFGNGWQWNAPNPRWSYRANGEWNPTQSPVHRGNDGLPFPLDDLTLSPAKWRTEALKAYGNAIVPQVMYEIFRAIEIAENLS